MPDDDVPVVAVLGAIGPDKGARRIERLVELNARAAMRRCASSSSAISTSSAARGNRTTRGFTVHGRYDSRDLAALAARTTASQLVLFPSAGPETFSYTLSEAWRAGVPVARAADRRAGRARRGTGAGWVLGDDEWRDESRMLARVVALSRTGRRCRASRAPR